MTKGKKIGIAVAVILGAIILIVGTFTKPKATKAAIDPGTYTKNQVEKLYQLQDLTTKLYKDEETTDMAQLKSEISQIGGSQDSLYDGMISDLNSAKQAIGQTKYNQILQVLQNEVQPSYKKVISDANEIAKNGYDQNPGQTVQNYQSAMKAITDAQNLLTGANDNSASTSA